MNDDPHADLERRLRAGLHQGALPGAPDGLRQRLARLPSEPGASRLSSLFGGIRLAALASAAAVAIAFVLVVRALPGPSAAAPGPSLGSIATSGESASPSASASALPSSLPSTAPTNEPSAPSVAPSIPPSPTTGFTCGSSTTILPPTTSAVVKITDVRVGSHAGYDRIVLEFAGSGRPQLSVAIAKPPFVGDASGKTINVAGKSFLSLKLFDASGYPTYTGPSSFTPHYPNLAALVNTGDYEGYVTWIAGLGHSTCYRISTLTSPTRIVVDVQAP